MQGHSKNSEVLTQKLKNSSQNASPILQVHMWLTFPQIILLNSQQILVLCCQTEELFE